MGDNSPPRYEHEGNVYYRASSLGMCDRIFVALATHYTPMAHPQWFQEILDEGTNSEDAIIDAYQAKEEVEVINHQGTCQLHVFGNVYIVGHIDGELATPDDSKVGFEAKKIRDKSWSRFLRSGVEYLPTYPMQLSVYWHGRGWEACDVVGGRYVDGQIVEVEVKHLLTPPVPLAGIRKRILHLESLIRDDNMPVDVPCSSKQYPCPFFYLHDDDDEEPPQRPPDDVIETHLNEVAKIEAWLGEYKAQFKANEDRLKELKTGVLGWLAAGGVEDDDPRRVTLVDGRQYELKYRVTHRKGYEVQPTEFTTVSIAAVGDDGKKIKKTRAPRAKK